MKSRKLISGLLAATMLLSAAAPGGLIPQAQAARVNTLGDGLVLYSTFDEGDARDLSGNGHNGTVVGGIQFVEGKDGGKAVQITGQTAAGGDDSPGDRYVSYGKSAGIIPATGNFSISLWYQSTGASTNATILSNKNFKSGANQGFAIGDFASNLRMNLTGTAGGRKDINGSSNSTALGNAKTVKNTWSHLVVTVNRSGNMSFYVNGTLADNGTASLSGATGSIDAGLDLILGAGGNKNNAANNCIMDDLLIYDRVLTQAEITLLAAKTVPDLTPLGLDEGILLDVDFDGNVNDKSGNNYNGTLTGAGVTYVDSPFGSKAVRIVNKNAASGSANDSAVADSYVSFGKDISKLGLADKPFTMSFWYKPDPQMNGWSAILSNKDYGSGSNQGFALGYYDSNDCKMNLVPAGGKGTNTQVSGINLLQGGGWHQFTATVVPGGTLTAYVDGKSVGAKAIPGGTIDVGLPLILGAGGNLKNPVTNIQIDELRFYDRALNAANVEALYALNAEKAAAANASLRIGVMLAALNSMEESVLFPQTDIEAMKARLSDTLAALDGLSAADAAALLAEVEAEYQAFLVGKKPLASFHMISDVHVESSSASDANALTYIAAMEDMATINTDTTIAFINAGDNTQSGQADQYTGFYKATADHNPVTDEQTLILLGNHDVRGVSNGAVNASGSNWVSDPALPMPYWATAKGLYTTNNAPYMPNSAQTTLYHAKNLGTVADTEGYTFIMLNTERGLKDAMYMSDEQIAWFEQTMKEAYERDPQKPIFIISHQALNDTHWRSNTLNGFDGIQTDGTGYPYQTGADAKVKEIMERYPNGIVLSGHIHNGFGVASVIPRAYGVNVDVPSFNETENGVKDRGVGYEVMIYDGCVAFRARNFVTGSWLPQYDVTIPVGDNGYPQLIQELDPAMSDLLWYSEKDAATLEDAFGGFWNVVDSYYNQSGIAYNAAPPANLIFTPDQLALLAAEADKAWANLGVLNTVTKLDAPRRGTFEVLRDNWRAYLLGGTGDDLDLANPAVAAYVEGLNADAAEYWNSMVKSSTPNRDDLWLDLDMTPIKDYSNEAYTRSGNMATTFTRLRAIANAWGTVGCDFYHNDYVRDELVKALDYLMTSYFLYGEEGYGNWYHWEITAPTALMNITMVLYDELTPAQIATYTKNAKWYVPYCDKGGPNSNGPAMTGGNLLLKANAAAQIGILSEDEGLLDNVKAGVKKVLVYNDYGTFYKSDADGFYADGSYIQHQALAYIGGYGADLYNNLGVFLNTLNGSEWEIKYEDQSEKIAYDFVFNGIEPFLYETCTMDMVSSRDITRNGSTDRGRTSRILSALMPLRGTFPTMEQNTRFDSMMKYYLSQDPYYYYSHMSSITSIQMAAELVNDSSVRPRQGYTLTKTFAMDKTVHITPDFGFAVSMHSSRTYGHELINNEGKRTWNTSDGMFYLYDADESQYGGGYWATVDPTRLPGTTAEHTVFNNGDGDRTKNIYDWTGGASLDSFGAAGTHIRTLGTPGSDARNGTDVKKSYFMFGDRIVMMGSGITSSTGNEVETIVDNRKLLLDGSNAITVDGAAADLADTPAALENPDWLHVAGNVPGADVGYYFPADITVQALKETRTGNWKDQGDTSGTATNTFATFYVNHGAKPRNATYEYVLLPGMTAGETAAYAAAPDVEILQNDASIHAARDNTNGVVAANFWDNRTATVAGITVDRAASVVMQTTGNTVTMAVSDPTQQDKVITVSLATAGKLISADPNVSVVQTEPFLMFRVDTAKLGGGSSMATFDMVPAERLELVSTVTQLAPITVEANTPFLLLPLPETAVFMANDMQEHTLPIIWTRNGYLTSPYGEYTVIATPVLGDRYLNGAGVSLQVSVLVNGGSPQQLAECDTYVNDGKYADDVMGGGGTATGIPVKQDDPGYYRKSLFRIDIMGVPTDCDEVYFTFQVSVPLDSGFLGAELYQVSNDWDQSAVTWNTIPGRTGEKPAASFKPGDVSADGVVQLNVTAAVKAAQAAGLEAISFELTAVGGRNGGKNQMTVQTLESDAAQKPALNWDIVQAAAAADKSNLKMLVEFAKELDAAQFSNYNETAFRDAIAAAQAVLDDKNAGIDQVNDAEDVLLRLLLALRVKPLPIV